jgi:hypothetical protein
MPRVSASVTAGLASPLHADLEFNTPEWQLAVRAATDKHVALEVFFDQWRQAEATVASGGRFSGIGGLTGTYDAIRYGTEFTVRTVGFNALLSQSFGRVSVSGGGGPGFLVLRRVSWLKYQNCRVNQPDACVNGRSSHADGSFSIQGVAGSEITITTRTPTIAVVTRFQFILPVRDPGSGHTSLLAGLRVGLR